MPNTNTLTTEEALQNIDNALASLNTNRQGHIILQASYEKVKQEIVSLSETVMNLSEENARLRDARLRETQGK